MKRMWVVLSVLVCLAGCASWKSENGVENLWRSGGSPDWVIGTSTEADVTNAFGPPSQIISMRERTVFYYLREEKRGKGLVLLLWNWGEIRTVYDRAIFIFNPAGVLTHYAYSKEAPSDDAQ